MSSPLTLDSRIHSPMLSFSKRSKRIPNHHATDLLLNAGKPKWERQNMAIERKVLEYPIRSQSFHSTQRLLVMSLAWGREAGCSQIQFIKES